VRNLEFAGAALSAISLCGAAYLSVALAASVRARRRSIPNPKTTPPVTVLKPLHGFEHELFENLCSFCEQDYEGFQVIFSVASIDDPAVPIARRVISRYPALDVELVVDSHPRGRNPKMSKVAAMLGSVKHDIVTIVDADMRVGPDYLRAIVAEFGDDRVGAVTALYSGSPVAGFSSLLGAMHINDQFAPSILVAALLGPVQFTFGSTMAVRRTALDAIGGIDALCDHLADDYMLGALVARSGYRVVLSPYVVRNVVYEPGLIALWHHELRWARTIRAQRPTGYACSVITFPLPFAVALFCLPGHAPAGCALTLLTFALRLALHRSMQRLLDRPTKRTAWLLPLRDALGLGVWVASYFGRNVRWRGAPFAAKG
jgi:ceramide glucosyltransferase